MPACVQGLLYERQQTESNNNLLQTSVYIFVRLKLNVVHVCVHMHACVCMSMVTDLSQVTGQER